MKSLSSRCNLRPRASCTVVLEGAVSNFLKHSTSASLFSYTALTVLDLKFHLVEDGVGICLEDTSSSAERR